MNTTCPNYLRFNIFTTRCSIAVPLAVDCKVGNVLCERPTSCFVDIGVCIFCCFDDLFFVHEDSTTMFPIKQQGNSKNTININAASIVDLKAELLRKQDQLRSRKPNNDETTDSQLYDASTYRASRLPKKIHEALAEPKSEKQVRSLENKKDREARNQQRLEEEKVHAKSKEMLMKKSQLYEKMKKGQVVVDDDDDEDVLVNFGEKAKLYRHEDDSEDDDEMVEIVDNFGRNRTVPKRDAHLYVTKDEDSYDDEDSSDDFEREDRQREQYPKEEEIKISKPKIFYADVDDGEIRDHGAAHYALSADEEVRTKQLLLLNTLRKETETKRAERNRIKERRAQMLKDRLAKVAARKGIELPKEEEKTEPTKNDDEQEEPIGPKIAIHKANERLKAESAKYSMQIREWDIGKEGLHEAAYARRPTTSRSRTFDDDNYYERLRNERNQMFAPPQIYEPSSKKARTSNPNRQVSSDEDDHNDPLYDVDSIVDEKLNEIRYNMNR